MSNLAEPRAVPLATTRRSRRLSVIWIVPIVAVAIGAWLAWDTLSKEGPTIKITFDGGEGLGWDIAAMAEYVTIHAFVRAPYDSYVHDQTRFWNASGVSVKLGGTGVEVQM